MAQNQETITQYRDWETVSQVSQSRYVRVHRYDKDPLWISIVSGLFFGIYLTPFGFGSFTGGPIKIIPYWVLLFSLNTFFLLNRSSYRNRVKESLDKVKEEREEKIDKLLNPVKRKFFQ